MSNCAFCRKVIIADIPGLSPKVLEIVDGEPFIVHERCGEQIVEELAQQKTKIAQYAFLKRVLRVLSMCLTFVLLVSAKNEGWVKGALVVAVKNDGGCWFKPFVKVGDTTNNPDDDSPQILGFTPGEVVVDRNGEVVLERVSEDLFIPLNQRRVVNGRLCKCPPYNL